MNADTPGERIARARRRRGLSQTVLAGLVGRSESWLSQVERGKRRADSHEVLTRLADVLRIDIDEITGPAGNKDEETMRAYQPADEIERAMMRYDEAAAAVSGSRPAAAARFSYLRASAQSAYRDYQAARYEETGRVLPALIRDAETVARAPGGSSPDACEARVIVYDTAAALLRRVGEPALAWAAADRAMAAAEQSGRPARAAAAAWRLSYVVNSRKQSAAALELAMTAAGALESSLCSVPEQLSIYGALHLAAVNAAASVYDRATVTTLLAKAEEIASQTGNGNYLGTAFGPVNVAMHTLSAALKLGDAKTAVETGESLDPDALPAGCTARRTQVRLDLARAYAMRKQDAAAVNMLLDAEHISPQLVRYDSRTRDVLSLLLRREHRPSTPELRPLAHRAGVI